MFEKLDIFMGDDIFLPMQQLNHLRRQGLEALEEEMLRPWKQRKAKERDLKDIPETEKQTTQEFLTAAVETEEQLAAVEKTDGVKRIYADCGIFPVSGFVQNVERWIHRLEEEGKELFLTLPRIVRDRELDGRKETFQELVQKGLGGFLVRNMESYGTYLPDRSGCEYLYNEQPGRSVLDEKRNSRRYGSAGTECKRTGTQKQ